jgi:hypothetical protein
MIWKQYSYAALVGACSAFGVIAASRIGDHSLGAAPCHRRVHSHGNPDRKDDQSR